MTKFEIEIYKLINTNFKGIAHRLTFPQILSAIGKADASLNDKSAIASLLHDEKFQRVLWQVGTLLWIGQDHKVRIVDSQNMKLRQDVGRSMCRLCLMDESDHRELVYNRDGESWVHPLCQERFQKLQALKQREVVTDE
ncbi:hypothetical protein D3C77_358080 [compost metagenome]